MDASPATAPAPGDVLGAAGARVPVRCHGRDVTWDDVVEHLALRGGWAPVVDVVGRADGARSTADADVLADIESRLPAAEVALRRRLRLTAADDYLAWLDGWGLTVDDCRDHLRRTLVPAGDRSAAGAASRSGVRAHLVLEGVLEAAVQRLAQDAALADVDPASRTWLVDIVRASDAVRSRAPRDDDLAAVVGEHAVDWTRVDATVVLVPDDDVARELLLCVHDRHAPLATVAVEVGLAPTTLSTTLEELEPWLEPVLVGAEPGALVGPLAHPRGRAVVALLARTSPSMLDDDVRRRAVDVLLERRAAVAMSSSVRWSADA